VVRKVGDFGEQDFMVATNHFLTEGMQGANKKGVRGGPSPDSFYRYDSVFRLVSENHSKLTPQLAMQIMGKHAYWDGQKWVEDASTGRTPCKHSASSRTNCTLTANVVLPTDKTVYVCTGNPCGHWAWDGVMGYDGYVEIQLKGSPRETTGFIKDRAAALIYSASMLPDEKLSPRLAQKAQKALWEYVEGNTAETYGDYTDASSHFAKAQAYARYALNKVK